MKSNISKKRSRLFNWFRISAASVFTFIIVFCFVSLYNTRTDSFIHHESVEKDDSIEFIFMESSALRLGADQNIFVSFYDDNYAKSSTLTIHKESCEAEVYRPTKVQDSVALFNIPFSNESQIGKYLFDKVSWGGIDAGYQTIENTDKGYAFMVEPSYELENGPEKPVDIINLSDRNGEMLMSNGSHSLANERNKHLTICLDPGHGGSDGGAPSPDHTLKESNINLRIAQVCKDELSKYAGVTVVMTRNGNVDVDLKQRCDIAKKAGADLFVSFHCNSGGATPGTGAEVWVQYPGCEWHNEFNRIGSDIASKILSKLSKFGLKNRGQKADKWGGRTYPNGSTGDYFAVLYWSRYYEIPGILIEHAFMDGDCEFLRNDSNLVKLGKADAESIAEYYGLSGQPSDLLSGTYIAKSELNNNYVIDVENSSFEDLASIVLNDNKNTDTSIFESENWMLETKDNNSVAIKNINSGKYLDVAGGKVTEGGTVCQYTYNGNDNQLWKLRKDKSSYYILSCLDENFALTVDSQTASVGCKLKMSKVSDNNNQKFNMQINIPGSDGSIEEGYYVFQSVDNNNEVIDVASCSLASGASYITYKDDGISNNHIFHVTKDGKYHRISNIASDKFFDLNNSCTALGTKITQWDYKQDALNQCWSIQKQDGNSYSLVSAASGLVVDISGGKAYDCADIFAYSWHNGNGQKWIFSKVEDPYNKLDRLATQYSSVIEDGEYIISTSIGNNLVLEVLGNSLQDNANVDVYTNHYGANQIWKVTHDNKNYVHFTNKNSVTKSLTIQDESKAVSSNACQYESSNINAQKWIVIPNNDGSFKIISGLITNLNLCVNAVSAVDCSNVIVTKDSNGNNRNFSLFRTDEPIKPSDADIIDGYYTLNSLNNNKIAVDVNMASIAEGENIISWSADGISNNQIFKLEKTADGYHTIINALSGYAVDIWNAGKSPGTNIIQWRRNYQDNQKWSIRKSGDAYVIQSVSNGLVIDISGGTAYDGANIMCWGDHNGTAQRWILNSVADPYESVKVLAQQYKNLIAEDWYKISSLAGNNMVLDVADASMADCASVLAFPFHNTPNECWHVSYDEDGFARIYNYNSGKYLDVLSGLKCHSTSICQYTYQQNNLNQKWVIIPDGNGYKIISALIANLNMSVNSTYISSYSNLFVSKYSGTSAQQFKFEKMEPKFGTPICHPNRTTKEKMINYFNSSGYKYPDHYKNKGYGGETLSIFCDIIIEEAEYEDVDPAVVFCQAMKETGWLQFKGDVKIDQCNFCGLGATGGGNPGESFNKWGKDSVRMGLRAQVQHLKRYAVGTLNRPGKPVDPRFNYPDPGCAPTVEKLGGHWAPGLTYGTEIVAMMQNIC